MRRSDALAKYQESSQKTSENVRQLAFAALGVFWLFRLPNGSWVWPRLLVAAGVLATSALFFDFVQYVWNTVAWGRFHARQEMARIPLDGEILAPRSINRTGNVLFALKTIALCGAYVVLLYVVGQHLSAP
jgi:hypothetical protein